MRKAWVFLEVWKEQILFSLHFSTSSFKQILSAKWQNSYESKLHHNFVQREQRVNTSHFVLCLMSFSKMVILGAFYFA